MCIQDHTIFCLLICEKEAVPLVSLPINKTFGYLPEK